jgi:DNA-binding NarL/FixJ family response regulator
VAEGNLYFTEEVHKKILDSYTKQLTEKKEEVVFTQREKEILQLLAQEYTNEKIATALHISYRTVETHRKNMLQKTGSHNLAGLLKYAFNKQIIS